MYNLIKNIDELKNRQIQITLIEWEKENYLDFPWRYAEYKLHALIAEVMLQKTRAEQVTPIYITLIGRYPTLDDFLKEDPDKIRELLKPLGLYKRTEKILELVNVIYKKGCTIPDTKEELMKLPGVGLYTANAFLSFHLGVRAPIIDTNALRLWSRLFGFKPKKNTHRIKWFKALADKITPKCEFKVFNYAVLDYTRIICKLKPLCKTCQLRNLCNYVQPS